MKKELKSKNILPEEPKKELNINKDETNLQRLSIFENFIPKKELINENKDDKQSYQEEIKYI